MRFSESASFETPRTAKKNFSKKFFFSDQKKFFEKMVQKIFFFWKTGGHVTIPGPNRPVDGSLETRTHALSNGI